MNQDSRITVLPRPPPEKEGRILRVVLPPIQVSLMQNTTDKATETPGFIPLRFAQPM